MLGREREKERERERNCAAAEWEHQRVSEVCSDAVIDLILIFIIFFFFYLHHDGSTRVGEKAAAGLEVERRRHPGVQPVHPAAACRQHQGEFTDHSR